MAYREPNLATNILFDNSITLLSSSPVNVQTALEALKAFIDSEIAEIDGFGSILDKDLTAPPGSPSTGDRYIIASVATGDWAAHEKKVAEWNGSAWVFTTPTVGAHAYIVDEAIFYLYNGTHPTGSWVKLSSIIVHNELSGLTTGDPHTQYVLATGTRNTNVPSTNKTANYTVLSSDNFIACDPSGGTFTITLEAAPSAGRELTIKDTGNATGSLKIIISGNGKVIDGSATQEITTSYTSLGLHYQATLDKWYIK